MLHSYMQSRRFKISILVVSIVAAIIVIVAIAIPSKNKDVSVPPITETLEESVVSELPEDVKDYIEAHYESICKDVSYGVSTFDFANITKLQDNLYICPFDYTDTDSEMYCCTFTVIPQTGEYIHVIENYADWEDD